MNTTCIKIEGGLLAPDFLETIADAEGQKPGDFGIEGRRTLVDEVSSLWSDVRSYWDAFQRRLQRQSTESLTTITREQWVSPLLDALGYKLTYQQQGVEIDGRNYRVSHRTGDSDEDLPVHIEPFDQDLGSRPPSGRGIMSPHAMLQDYLNRSEHLWAIVTNGSTLRLLRDSSYFTRPSYVEFDLRQMLEGERLDEFFLFYRLVHRTRLPKKMSDGPDCLLEKYHQLGIEQGGRIRDGLRNAVEQAIVIFANGFLAHPRNEELRERLYAGTLAPAAFYQQLLYLIYRLLFLMVAEERGLLSGGDGEEHPARQYFTVQRLRALADEPLSAPERFCDLYLNLRALFHSLCDPKAAQLLGLPPLNGELFDCDRTSALGDAYLNNRHLLTAMHTLSWFVPRDQRVPTRVNYRHLDVEELGSVYESLLDLQPIVEEQNGRLTFRFGAGTERKTTGSYYTRPELVQELIKSALVPVIEDRLQAAKPQEREAALLGLTVCDPACGSGHFLLAAARRIGTELAKVRTGEEAPAPDAVREAVRDVITHCIYGVDKNPLAVDLCKVALWIEGHSGGKPLTFLDHRIRCGDSLVGVFDLSVLEEGIPDAAFDPVSGDDRKLASAIKKRNKQERTGQVSLPLDVAAEVHDLVEERRELETLHDDTPEEVHRKREAWVRLQRDGGTLWRERMACHLWTAAFFSELTQEAVDGHRIPTTEDLRRFLQSPVSVPRNEIAWYEGIAFRNRFFHWPLEFPEVFERGGFDCVLSNPPWDQMQFDPQEYFSARAPEVAAAPNMAARERMIEALSTSSPDLHREFASAQADSDRAKRFVHASDRFPLTEFGRVNLAPLFAELSRGLIAPVAQGGLILPTGIATDSFTSRFFADIMASGQVARLLGMDNEAMFFFPGIDHRNTFCILTLTGVGKPVWDPVFTFRCSRLEDTRRPERRYRLDAESIAVLNPNTRTCPVFRTCADAELSKTIYRAVPVLVDEAKSNSPWGITEMLMFMMNTGSRVFENAPGLTALGLRVSGNRFVGEASRYLPLYEGKMLYHFDHRYGTYENATEANIREGSLPQLPAARKEDPCCELLPRYWVAEDHVADRLRNYTRRWFLAFREVTNSIVERTAVFAALPRVAVGHKAPLLMTGDGVPAPKVACLLAASNSLAFDYAARQKVGGTSLSLFILKQLPMPTPDAYSAADLLFIVPRVVELTYTAWDIKAFADDVWRESGEWRMANGERQNGDAQDHSPLATHHSPALRAALEAQWEANRSETGGHEWAPPEWAEIAADGCPLPPFKWSDDRRAVLRAGLDAWYARLYGLTRKQLRYILDPHGLSERELADILDPWEDPTCQGPHLLPAEPALDFPGETFRVLKEKEEKAYGEYRTRRLVLEAWGRQEEAFSRRGDASHGVLR
jgi:hypothetical protein